MDRRAVGGVRRFREGAGGCERPHEQVHSRTPVLLSFSVWLPPVEAGEGAWSGGGSDLAGETSDLVNSQVRILCVERPPTGPSGFVHRAALPLSRGCSQGSLPAPIPPRTMALVIRHSPTHTHRCCESVARICRSHPRPHGSRPDVTGRRSTTALQHRLTSSIVNSP